MLSSQSFGMGSTPIELFGRTSGLQSALDNLAGGGQSIEANMWLPYAAEVYNLSKNMEDYVLVPVPGMFNDIPNTNGDCVTLAEMLRFNPDQGMQAFKTFRGKPTYTEHENNRTPELAKGVILDVFLRPIKGFGGGRYFKPVLLLAYDRTKDPMLVNSILSGENNAYSVGFFYKAYACSICGNIMTQDGGKPCGHVMPKKRTTMLQDGSRRLAYRMCQYITGFECSSVGNPAFVTAISPVVLDPSTVQ